MDANVKALIEAIKNFVLDLIALVAPELAEYLA